MGEQGYGDKGRHLGDTTGHGGAAGATAAAGIAETERGAGAVKDVRAGRGIGAGRYAGSKELDDFDSDPSTPLPLLVKGHPHQRRVTPAARSV